MPTKAALVAFFLLCVFLSQPTASADTDAAREAMMAGSYRRAATLLAGEAARGDEITGPHLRYLHGRSLQLAGDHRAALRSFDQLIRAFPDSPWVRKARLCRADSLGELDRVQEAAAIYREETDGLIGEDRRDETAKLFLTYAHAAFDPGGDDERKARDIPPDHATAKVLFTTVLELEPSEAMRHEAEHYLARCELELGNRWRARQLLAERLDDPDDPLAAEDRFQLARASAADMPVEAIRQYHLLVRLHPDDPLAGDALWKAARLEAPSNSTSPLDLDGAVADLGALVAGHPDHEHAADAHLRIARVLRWGGRWQRAAVAYRDYLDAPARAQHEDRPEGMVELARLLETMGDEAGALEVYRRYSAEFPTHSAWAEVQIHLADADLRQGHDRYREGDLDGAVDAYARHADSHAAEDADARYLIGLARYRQGRIEDAVAAFEAVASKFPHHPAGSRAEYALARILLEHDRDVDAARDRLESCQEHGGWSSGDCSVLALSLDQEGLDLYVDGPLRTGAAPQVWLRARNIEQVEMTLHRVDPEILMRKEGSIAAMDSLDVELIEPDVRWQVEDLDAADGLTWSGLVDLPVRQPGVYVVGATGKTLRAQIQVVVSDVTVATHRQGGDVLVYVQDRRSGRPVSGAEILLSDGASVFAEGRTGRTGTFLFQQAPGDDLTPAHVTALAMKGRQIASSDVEGYSLARPEELPLSAYVYTDRAAYRPGSAVGYRALLRRGHDRRAETPVGEAVRVRMVSHQGWTVASHEARLDRFGAVGGVLEAGDDFGIGPYHLFVDVAQANGGWSQAGSASFEVTDAAPSRRQLTIDLDRSVYVLGDEVTATVRATTYTGEPIAGVRVFYRWDHEEEGVSSPPTDADGAVVLRTSTLNHGGLYRAELTAALPGEPVQVRAAAPIRASEFALALDVDRDVLQQGEAVHVRVRATGAENAGIPADLEVSLHHVPDTPPTREWEGNPFEPPLWEEQASLVPEAAPPAQPAVVATLSTDSDGAALLERELTAPGTWRIAVVGRDARGNLVTDGAQVTVVAGEPTGRGLALLAEATTLPSAEPAQIRVLGPGPGPALAVIDADGIAAVRPVTLREDGQVLSIPLHPNLAPQARVTVLAVRGDQVLHGQVDLAIESGLDVHIEGLPEVTEPGTGVTASIRVTDEAGRPTDAQVSIAVVDASLMAQFPETRRDADGVFLPQSHDLSTATSGAIQLRSSGPGVQIDADILAEMERLSAHRARTAAIRPEEIGLYEEAGETYWLDNHEGLAGLGTSGYGSGAGGFAGRGSGIGVGGGQAIVAGGLGRARQIERFKAESALWLDDLTTGSDGVVEVVVPLPDRSASWEIIVVAFDQGTRSGDATADLTARAPLSVAVATPPFVRVGDAPGLVADLLADGGGRYAVEGAIGATSFSPVERELGDGRPLSLNLTGAPIAPSDAVRVSATSLLVPFDVAITGALGRSTDRLASPLAMADQPLQRWRSGRLDRATDLALTPPDGTIGDLQLLVELAPAGVPGALAMALARPSGCPGSPYADAHVAFAATALLDRPERLPDAQQDLVRSLARGHVLSLLEDRPLYSQRWSRPGAGHGGDLTAYGYVALVRGIRLGLLPGEADPQARAKAAEVRQQLLRKLQSDVHRGPEYQSMLLYALSFDEGDDAALAAALTRMLRDAESPIVLGRLASTAVRFGARDEVADRRGDLESALRAALASNDIRAIAATAEGLASLEPGHSLLPEAGDALEAHMTEVWTPLSTVSALSAALARIQGSQGMPAAVGVRLPDGREERVDFSRDARAVTLAATVAAGPVVVELTPTGRGPARYRVGLVGQAAPDTPLPDDPRITLQRVVRRQDMRYHGVPLGQGFGALTGQHEYWVDELVQLPVGRQSRVELTVRYGRDEPRDASGTMWVLEEMLPGGATVVPGSLGGALYAEVREDRIVAYLDGTASTSRLVYTLQGASPGTWTVPAAILRRLDDGEVFEVGETSSVTVVPYAQAATGALAELEVPADPYRPTPDELFALGERLAEEERWQDAAATLGDLLAMGTLEVRKGEQVAATLLRATVEIGDTEGTLRAFEMLMERDPSYQIPFQQVVAVAQAYEELGEYRRAVRVYRTTLGARFLTETRLGRTLEQENLVLPSLRFLYDLTTVYPDLPQVQNSLFHLPQIWADRAETAATDPAMRARGYSRATLLATSADWMLEFVARYPESPLAEEAGFHLAGTYLELESYPRATSVSRTFVRRFPEGAYTDDFLYMEGLAHLHDGDTGAAVARLERVAREQFTPPGGGSPAPSEQRALALYSIAQIHDARGRIGPALDYYREVSGRFRDAADAVARMEYVSLLGDQVVAIPADDAPRLEVRSRNVDAADLLLYRVDLMRLYLREKDLSRATEVRLAGIEPIHMRRVRLLGSAVQERTTTLPLPLGRPGAYLVVLKGEQAELSSMVLYSDLTLEIQEDRNAGRVRVSVFDPDGAPVPDTHVKVLGNNSAGIISGDTDLRGVFAADGVYGVPTVIARAGEHYAFWSGSAETRDQPPLPAASPAQEVDLMEAVRKQGVMQRATNRANFDEAYFAGDVQGVAVDQLK